MLGSGGTLVGALRPEQDMHGKAEESSMLRSSLATHHFLNRGSTASFTTSVAATTGAAALPSGFAVGAGAVGAAGGGISGDPVADAMGQIVRQHDTFVRNSSQAMTAVLRSENAALRRRLALAQAEVGRLKGFGHSAAGGGGGGVASTNLGGIGASQQCHADRESHSGLQHRGGLAPPSPPIATPPPMLPGSLEAEEPAVATTVSAREAGGGACHYSVYSSSEADLHDLGPSASHASHAVPGAFTSMGSLAPQAAGGGGGAASTSDSGPPSPSTAAGMKRTNTARTIAAVQAAQAAAAAKDHQMHDVPERLCPSMLPLGAGSESSFESPRKQEKSDDDMEERTRSRGSRVVRAQKALDLQLAYEPVHVLARLVLNSRFEFFMFFLVISNTAMLLVQADYLARAGTSESPTPFVVLECVFLSFYLLEVSVNICADAEYYFKGPGRVLNIVDCILVMLQILEIMVAIAAHGIDNSTNLSYLRIFRLTRAIRIFRSAKVLVMFQDVRAVAMAMFSSAKPFAGAAIVFFMWLMVWGIYITERMLPDNESEVEEAMIEVRRKLFGSMPKSVLTLFMALSGGIDWTEIVQVLPSGADVVLFCACVVFSLLVLMNVITGLVIKNVMQFAEADRLSCMIPLAEKALQDFGETGNFENDVMECLNSPPLHVRVTGFTGKASLANGDYMMQMLAPGTTDSRRRRARFEQRSGEGGNFMLHCAGNREWVIGSPYFGEVATKKGFGNWPPKGKWRIDSSDFGTPFVELVPNQRHKKLRTLLRLMELDDTDVMDIFRICDAMGQKVDMASFLSMYLEARQPARRLEQLLMVNNITPANQVLRAMGVGSSLPDEDGEGGPGDSGNKVVFRSSFSTRAKALRHSITMNQQRRTSHSMGRSSATPSNARLSSSTATAQEASAVACHVPRLGSAASSMEQPENDASGGSLSLPSSARSHQELVNTLQPTNRKLFSEWKIPSVR